MSVRTAAVAGQFYEASPQRCKEQIEQLLAARSLPDDLPQTILGGIVPHAGWVFSGDLAALVLAAIHRRHPQVDTFVIFGAVHTVRATRALAYDRGRWATPLGDIEIDETLTDEILSEAPDLIHVDLDGHRREHSIEVQVPFIQYFYPDARIVPMLVPPISQADQVGRAVARVLQRTDKITVCLGSSDLTHYGPSYGFTPMGTGAEGFRWAREKNDEFFINLALSMEAEKIVESAQLYGSACGPGAVAAVMAVARDLGCEKGRLLAHTTSADIIETKFFQKSADSVGYAGIIYGLEKTNSN